MPAPRLPWVKLWVESLDHEKIEMLPDPLYRTWTRCLLRGSQQTIKWRFASAEHAARVTARPLRHIKELTARHLLDVKPDGLHVHDAPYWQDRHPSDFGPRTVGKGSAKAPIKKEGTLREDSANAPQPLREGSGEREKEIETQSRVPESPTTDSAAERRPAPVPKPSGPSIEPLKKAFADLGLRVPGFAQGEASCAQALLEQAAPEQIARCWQDHATGDYPLADAFSRRDLSFNYLATRQRFFNWLTWDENGRLQDPVPAKPARNGAARNGRANPHEVQDREYRKALAATERKALTG